MVFGEQMQTIAVIPAYNVEKTITQVVKGAKKYCDTVVVVDDGSSDNTPNIIQGLGVKYAVHWENQGQGAATRTGIKIALELGADVVVTLDSDGQHDPNEISQVLKPILDGKADLVIGARFINKHKIPHYRKFGIDVINWLYNICNGRQLVDTQSCFRAFARQLINRLDMEEDGFGSSTEVLIKVRKMKARIIEVPISCIYHNLKQDSTMNPIKHGLMVAFKTIYWRLKLWA